MLNSKDLMGGCGDKDDATRSCNATIKLWTENGHVLAHHSWQHIIDVGSIMFTLPDSADGSLCREIWFNSEQLCTEPSTASGVATPAETLTANLVEIH